MDAFADSVAAADGVVRISNTIFAKDSADYRLAVLRPFISAFYEGAVGSPVGRREKKVSDILRQVADAVDAMDGEFDDYRTAHFLGEIIQGVGSGLKDGISVSQNSRQCLKGRT